MPFYLLNSVPEYPMSLLGKQEQAGGGAMLNKETGLWLIGRELSQARELRVVEWEGEAERGREMEQGREEGREGEGHWVGKGETPSDSSRWTAAQPAQPVWRCVWGWLSWCVHVLWNRVQWRVIVGRFCSSHLGRSQSMHTRGVCG